MNNIFLSFLVILLCSLTKVSQSKSHGNSDFFKERTAGGLEKTIEEHPYQVYLGNKCGGSIISPYFILTAAHCVNKSPVVEVKAGSTLADGRLRTVYTSKQIIVHPLYNSSTFDYDIALIEVQQDMCLNGKTMKAINLPPLGSSSVKPGTLLVVSGYGLANDNSSNTQLRAVVVPAVSHKYCSRAFSPIKTVTSRMFCAGKGGKNSCLGDYGSPAVDVTSGLQIGVVSWGIKKCPPPGYPVVYTDLTNKEIRSWIELITGI